MKTLEQYIAERRRILEPDGSQEWISAFFKDSEKHMPRVLDMLEKQQNLINYFAEYFSHDAGLNFVFDRARVCKQDLEKMVNE